MTKKKSGSEGSVTFTVDKDVASALGLTQDSDIIMFVLGDMLIIKSKHKQGDEAKNALTESLMDKYDDVLKKLANT